MPARGQDGCDSLDTACASLRGIESTKSPSATDHTIRLV